MTGCRPFVVVVSGSECTGKTTLARELAAEFGAPCSAEYAREYLEAKASPLVAGDVEFIARGQMAREDAAVGAASVVAIKDTDLVSTVVYARHYYGTCQAWIEQAAGARLGDQYLLLHPDVAWVADGLQRDRPDDRALLHGLFRRRLQDLGANTVDIVGSWSDRRRLAFDAVRRLLASRGQARI